MKRPIAAEEMIVVAAGAGENSERHHSGVARSWGAKARPERGSEVLVFLEKQIAYN
jgi:hypothetical protein